MKVSQAFAVIDSLDLEPIKMKLMHESGEGWTATQVEAAETEYRRYLYLMKTHPNEQLVPLEYVDTFWHYHILDTQKYAADCDRVFGYFLHHFPYLGMRGKEDELARHEVVERMACLYEQTFGEAYMRSGAAAEAAFCADAKPAFCADAKPAFCADARPAFCADAKPAFCAGAKPAFCADAKAASGAGAKPAFCADAKAASAGAKPAFCAGSKPAYCT